MYLTVRTWTISLNKENVMASVKNYNAMNMFEI